MRAARVISIFLASAILAADVGAGEALPVTYRRNKALNAAFASLALRLRRGVVDIRGGAENVRAASGTLIGNGSYIVTAASLLEKDDKYRVVAWNGASANATVLGRDELNDVAVLALEGSLPNTSAFDLENRAEIALGRWVVSVGITSEPEAVGTVSALDRRIRRFEIPLLLFGLYGLFDDANRGMPRSWPKVIQHDGPLASDKLGTALVDSSGRFAGINVSAPFRGSSLAVPAEVILKVLPILKSGKDIKAEGFLGVRSDLLSWRLKRELDIKWGVKVTEVVPGSAAGKAGIKVGDIVLEVDGEKVRTPADLAEIVKYLEVGRSATVKLQRGKRRRSMRVTIGRRPGKTMEEGKRGKGEKK